MSESEVGPGGPRVNAESESGHRNFAMESSALAERGQVGAG